MSTLGQTNLPLSVAFNSEEKEHDSVANFGKMTDTDNCLNEHISASCQNEGNSLEHSALPAVFQNGDDGDVAQRSAFATVPGNAELTEASLTETDNAATSLTMSEAKLWSEDRSRATPRQSLSEEFVPSPLTTAANVLTGITADSLTQRTISNLLDQERAKRDVMVLQAQMELAKTERELMAAKTANEEIKVEFGVERQLRIDAEHALKAMMAQKQSMKEEIDALHENLRLSEAHMREIEQVNSKLEAQAEDANAKCEAAVRVRNFLSTRMRTAANAIAELQSKLALAKAENADLRAVVDASDDMTSHSPSSISPLRFRRSAPVSPESSQFLKFVHDQRQHSDDVAAIIGSLPFDSLSVGATSQDGSTAASSISNLDTCGNQPSEVPSECKSADCQTVIRNSGDIH